MTLNFKETQKTKLVEEKFYSVEAKERWEVRRLEVVDDLHKFSAVDGVAGKKQVHTLSVFGKWRCQSKYF